MEFDYKTFLPLLLIALSTLIGSFAYMYKVREEAKKSYRKTLFNLLEIRYAILMSLFDAKEATEKYIELFTRRTALTKENIPEEMFVMMQEHFKKITLTFKIDIENKLLVPYEKALSELAIIDPVLSYKLAGKEKAEELLIHSNQYEKDFNIYLSSTNKDYQYNDRLLSGIKNEKNKAIKELLESFDKDIKVVAWNCGLLDYFGCLKVINKGVSIENQYNFEGLDSVFDRLIVHTNETSVPKQ